SARAANAGQERRGSIESPSSPCWPEPSEKVRRGQLIRCIRDTADAAEALARQAIARRDNRAGSNFSRYLFPVNSRPAHVRSTAACSNTVSPATTVRSTRPCILASSNGEFLERERRVSLLTTQGSPRSIRTRSAGA